MHPSWVLVFALGSVASGPFTEPTFSRLLLYSGNSQLNGSSVFLSSYIGVIHNLMDPLPSLAYSYIVVIHNLMDLSSYIVVIQAFTFSRFLLYRCNSYT